VRNAEPRRQNADDFVLAAVEAHRLADVPRIRTELRTPELIAQYHNKGTIRLGISRCEQTATDRHHAERLLRLAGGDTADVPRDALRPRVYPDAADREAVDALLSAVPNDERPLVALAPGSVWATKRWPYYTELAQRLRPDSVTETDQRELFQSVAPAVERGLYLVPKVIE